MADAGELVVRVSADTKDLESALKSAQKTIDKIGSSFQKVGSQLTRGLTVPIAAAGTAIMGVWNNIDEVEDNIIAKTGALGETAASLKGTFKNVFGSMPTDAQTASDAIAELNTQFGLMGKQLEDASKYLIMFSKITGANVTEAAQQAEKAMRVFNVPVKRLPDVLDAVAAAAQKTGISTNELMQIVVDLAPQLKKLGFNLASSIKFISETEKAGIDTSKAVIYLGRALANGAKKGKSTSAMLDEMAKKFANAKTETEQTALAMEYFGAKGAYTLIAAIQQGQISLSDLAKAAKQTQDPLAGLNETTGTVAKTYEETLDPIDKFKAKMNELVLKIAPLGVTLQETIEPALSNIIDYIGKLLDWLNKLDPTTKNMIVQVGVALAVLGPLVSIIEGVIKTIATVIGWIGKIVGALQSLWGVVSGVVSAIAGVIGWPALVVAAVAAGVVVLVKYWDQISAFIKTAYKWIVDTFMKLWNTIKGPLQNLWNDVQGWLQPVFDVFVNVFTAIKNAVKSIWDGLVNVLKTPLNWIIGAVNTIISGLNKIHFSIPSWVPGLGGKSFGINIATIPQLATGGIVTRPTLAMIGEAGPEAVVPLNGPGLGGYIIIKQMIVREEADIDRISQQLASKVLQAQKYRGGEVVDFTFNGTSAFTYGVNVTDIRIFSPEVRDEYEYIPGKDGSYIFNAAYGDRRVEVDCYIARSTVEETLAKEREITGWLLRPQQRAQLRFTTDQTVYFMAKVDEQIEFNHQLNVSFFTISFNCEPFIYSVQEYEKTVQVASGGTMYVQVEGTAYTYPVIEISPVSANITGGQLQVRGIKLNINLPINAGETLILDTAKLTATKNGANVLANISGTFMPLWSGINSVYWLANNGAAANITFKYHARWL